MIMTLFILSVFSLHQLPANEEAVCSWYGGNFHGRLTACGEIYDMYEFTAAHKTLPIGTIVELENDRNRVRVIINDRGPYIHGRDFDLSLGAFKRLAPPKEGIIRVKYVIIGREIRDTMRYNL